MNTTGRTIGHTTKLVVHPNSDGTFFYVDEKIKMDAGFIWSRDAVAYCRLDPRTGKFSYRVAGGFHVWHGRTSSLASAMKGLCRLMGLGNVSVDYVAELGA